MCRLSLTKYVIMYFSARLTIYKALKGGKHMATANEIADFFLCFSHKHGDCLTNLKLQKLLYYAQAWYLTLYNKNLFEEDIQAWVHGPVVYSVYNRFKDYRWNDITEQPMPPKLSIGEQKHLLEIINVFGKFSAWELEQMTHNETPWKNARGGLPVDEPCSNVINSDDMKSYYSQFISK
jgi:uncharacterized phage-associated protein